MSKELNLNDLLKPTKVLTFGKIKIHLQGIDTVQEHFIDSLKYKHYPSLEDQDKASAEYLRRLICSMVKKVEGVKVNGVDWDVSFIDSSNREIDMASYVVINRIMDKVKSFDFAGEIMSFYNKQKEDLGDAISFDEDEDKKKD